MASVIAPAILAESTDQYKQLMERIQAFAERVHIDICDGEFAPAFTVAANQVWWPANWQADIHAMVARPSEHVDQLIALKPSLIIFHAEVAEDLIPLVQKIQGSGIKAGVALQRPTVPATVAALIQQVDHVMLFSGDLGHYGGTASMMQLEKARLVRAIKPSVEIGWDGGVVIENAYSLSQGGVDVLNVGGALARSNDPATTYKNLVEEVNKQTVI